MGVLVRPPLTLPSLISHPTQTMRPKLLPSRHSCYHDRDDGYTCSGGFYIFCITGVASQGRSKIPRARASYVMYQKQFFIAQRGPPVYRTCLQPSCVFELSPSCSRLVGHHQIGPSSSTPGSTSSSFFRISDKELPSLRYTQSPCPLPSFALIPSCATTQSKRFGPEMGELSQIWRFGGCLLST